ncbi:putative serine hydroxymethyltransferase [Leishmania mexicana MHOM/GT/2001/U1103]|uniref:Serine hydroxymethyltransferase n=1 Tax=Leishmania mexicana (strain MHOM/GT/2001/U1103) TaxID=929439 RepID=E9APY0_LEIMU|nr:putative serine hydroxymethyltransferase [Leishmania mexicana MHOM/GT/2001/U1103]CBZ24997.1 putative serine hydroxymethyltransferase [Leishmania mexicana MHOM/GT/2001/U1103]
MASLIPTLAEQDPELANMIELEMSRQFRGLEMIASENLTSKAVLECLGSTLTNKYAEGEPGNRYYGGTAFVDMVENLAKKRALSAFSLDPEEWGVNVQPYSGSPANFAVYTGLLEPHSRIMGLDLPSGGHLTHGFYTPKKKVSATSIYFESFPYHVKEDGLIGYDALESVALVFRPKMIIAGASAYARDFDYERFRHICDEVGSLLFMDMAHTAGLIAGGVLKSPFPYADVVTTTTHKSLRGPRAGMIFYRKKDRQGNPTDHESRINQAVFPGCQGGPHEHQIAAIATQMREVCSQEWKAYAVQVQSNARALAAALSSKGHVFVSGGTDNHLLLWNVRVHGLTGSKMEKLLDAVSISVNKNTIPGDKSAMTPGGIRIGTLALTSRGMVEADMITVAEFLDRAIVLAKQIQAGMNTVKLSDFVEALQTHAGVAALRTDVEAFATTFAMPSFDVERIKYKDSLPGEH